MSDLGRAESDTTRSRNDLVAQPEAPVVVGLTILAHPEVERVGERAPLDGLQRGRAESLSRRAPAFCQPGGSSLRPLADAHISRQPLSFSSGSAPGSIRIDPEGSRTDLEADGCALTGAREFSAGELERGVVLLLAGRVALLLHRFDPLAGRGLPDFGLVGQSAAIAALRREIRRVARLDVPVLLAGESGSGKELVARAIHDAGARRAQPYVALNLGAIPPTLAAAELFGAARGAFTGADRARPGYFERARGGTLFLDEIGDAPGEVQSMLLRALDSGEIQAVGDALPQRVDVRLIAATDVDLRAAVAAERFRAPLLYRLEGYRIDLPPLRARRDDIGRLLFHFLEDELRAAGALRRLSAPRAERPAWLPAALAARLLAYDWPGNVRQLRNVARRLVVAGLEHDSVPLASLEGLLGETEDAPRLEPDRAAAPARDAEALPAPAAPGRRYRWAKGVGDDELLAVLAANRWRIEPTARQLRVSRTSLYERLEHLPGARKAAEIGRDELLACRERYAGDLYRMVDELHVSRKALARRLGELGLA